ncbi:MAG TPA: lactonase family protein [Terracidiphilus sp.]|jgi:6-phosphogluconolactonase|nr:lactonase family protein [Terracidiphilus sp.]
MTSPFEVNLVSRRRFIAGAAALVAASGLRGVASQSGILRAYVGTYTETSGNGEGIYLFTMDRATGELRDRKLVAKSPSPSWIVIHPNHRFLYAANEVNDYEGNSGSISAFSVDAASGDLTLLNVVSSEGAGPAYLSLDGTGKFAFVANYAGGTLAALPILESGALGPAVFKHQDEGALGAAQANTAPAGSFAISGHDAPHVHMIAASPDNRFVLATDLGQDRIYIYSFDAKSGKLTPNGTTPFVALPSGDGPRHFAFHPSGRYLFAMQEESSTVVSFRYDAATGNLTPQQTISALPDGFAGTSFASEILVSPDGKSLYAANRLHDTIAVYAINREGHLSRIGETPTGGDYPVQCRIDPTGNFFYACNRKSDSITSFRIDRATGRLTSTGRFTVVGSAASITFLE